ncbi:hypothetical protein ACFLVE_04310 [Chloroflexota bacterium]
MNRKIIESCISALIKDFRHNTLNFIKEEDLRSKLYSIMDVKGAFKKGVDISEGMVDTFLVHVNWFGLKSAKENVTKGYCDLVVLKEESAEELHNLAGRSTSIFAKQLPCYAGIEIKRWPGELHNPPNKRDKSDVIDLKSMLESGKVMHGYSLVFIDHDIDERNESKYTKIIEWYRKQTQNTENLHVWLIPRTGKICRL